MKKLLKSEIYGSVNNAHCALFMGKVKHFGSQKKKKNRRNAKRAFGKCKRTLSLVSLIEYSGLDLFVCV